MVQPLYALFFLIAYVIEGDFVFRIFFRTFRWMAPKRKSAGLDAIRSVKVRIFGRGLRRYVPYASSSILSAYGTYVRLTANPCFPYHSLNTVQSIRQLRFPSFFISNNAPVKSASPRP